MGLVSDARKAMNLLTRALRVRKAIADAERLQRARGLLPPRHFKIAVYFADGPVNLYQLRQWYAPLVALAEKWPVVIIARTAPGARALFAESPVPVEYARSIDDVESLLAAQEIRVVLYVNQNTRNFQMFRYGHRWHVFISHGESDKVYMRSNQIRTYDYAFVAGDAAIARLSESLWGYDVERRAIPIGRPQVDHLGDEDPPYPADGRVTVFYAPTWEGDRASMAYGSVASHGERFCRALLADSRFRLIYRPHPRSGVFDPAYGAANERIVSAIAEANRADSTAMHVHDQRGALTWQLSATDVAVMDVSAMVYDRLAVGRPLLVTRPVSAAAVVDAAGYLAACEWLDAADVADLDAFLARAQDPELTGRLEHWSTYYFGDTSPGASTARFHGAITTLMQEWERWRDDKGGEDAIEHDDEDESDSTELGVDD